MDNLQTTGIWYGLFLNEIRNLKVVIKHLNGGIDNNQFFRLCIGYLQEFNLLIDQKFEKYLKDLATIEFSNILQEGDLPMPIKYDQQLSIIETLHDNLLKYNGFDILELKRISESIDLDQILIKFKIK